MPKRSKRFTHRTVLISTVLVISLLLLGAILLIRHQHKFAQQTIQSSSSKSGSASAPASNGSTSSSPPASSPEPSKESSNGGSSAILLAPYGNFVSNHNLGNGRPTTEQSVCNTTPGASCYIKFTKSDGSVKTLAAQTTDNNGTTIWNWDVKDAGFSAGSWQITAVASLNGDVKTTTDPTPLEIQP